MDLTAIHCRSIFLNTRLIEGLYKRFAHVFDAGDDQLVRDRFLTLHYASCFMLFTTAVLVPCIAIGVCGYLYKVQWLYALAISLFILPFIWRLIYRWYILSASSSFVYSTRNFDSCLNSVITAIREREVISFGVLVNSAGEFHCCNRVLRTELLNSLRSFVRAYMNASEKIALSEEKGKLLRSFFTEAMTQLALNDEVIDRFLHLPSLKELFKLLSLVRSEYIRLTLFRLTEVDAYGGLKVIYSLRKFKKMQNKFRKRFTSALKYVFVEEDDDLVGSQPNKSRPPASTRERAVVELGLALQILKKSDSDENKKKATGILYDVIEMISPKKDKKKDEEVKKVENSNEQTERSFERSSFDGDKVYEGISERMEECEGSKAAFYTKLQKRTPMTHAVVRELKTVIGSRRRSSTSSNETDVGLKIVLNKSSDDSSASSPFQDSSFLSSTTSSDEIVLPMSYLDSKVETEVPSSSYDYLHAGILEAIRPRAKIPVTSYGDSDDD